MVYLNMQLPSYWHKTAFYCRLVSSTGSKRESISVDSCIKRLPLGLGIQFSDFTSPEVNWTEMDVWILFVALTPQKPAWVQVMELRALLWVPVYKICVFSQLALISRYSCPSKLFKARAGNNKTIQVWEGATCLQLLWALFSGLKNKRKSVRHKISPTTGLFTGYTLVVSSSRVYVVAVYCHQGAVSITIGLLVL